MSMSSFTTSVRSICEMYTTKQRSGYMAIPDIIDKAVPKVFDFDYPIFDESYIRVLENKILLHYYTREIGEETVGLWKLRLMSRLNDIMPYYNQLYESALLKYNPLVDVDYTEEHKGRENTTKKQYRDKDTTATTDFAEHVDTDYTLNGTENIVDNTKDVENTVTKTVSAEDIDYTDTKTTDEHIKTVTDTTEHETENVLDVEDKALNKDVTLNDTETTDTTENEISNTVAHKVGDNDTHVKDDGHNVDTLVIDETKVRTPDLTNDKQNNKRFDDLGTGADNRNIQRSEYTATTDDSRGTNDVETESHKDTDTLDLHSDTPQGNLIHTDNGLGGNDDTDPNGNPLTLREKLNTGWLTDARQVTSVENEQGESHGVTTANTKGSKKFDETTDDDVTHIHNYYQLTDDNTVTRDTGTETEDKTGTDLTTRDIDETHHTHYDIDETTTTDFTDDKIAHKDFNKVQTENTKQTEHNVENIDKERNKDVHTVSDTQRDVTENETAHTDDDKTTDFTGTVDGNTDYTRDKGFENVYTGDKDTENNKKFLENVKDNLKNNIRNTDQYINHTVGKISNITYSKMLLDFRATFLNIDMMIIDELSDLFFGLYF